MPGLTEISKYKIHSQFASMKCCREQGVYNQAHVINAGWTLFGEIVKCFLITTILELLISYVFTI